MLRKFVTCRLSIDEVKTVINDKGANYSYVEDIRKNAAGRSKLAIDDSICTVCAHRLCISDQGVVYPCEGWQNCVIGNLQSLPLKWIWEKSEKIKRLRSICLQDFPQCVNCTDRPYCEICMLRNANESHTGNPMEINPYFCSIANIKHEMVDRLNLMSSSTF